MEEDKKKTVDKVRLDSDNILPSELFTPEGKKNTGEEKSKVRIDFEGVLEEEIPQELEVPAQTHPGAQKKESKPKQAPKSLPRLFFIVALIGGGILVLVAAGWFVVSLLFHSATETTEETAGKEEQTELVQGSEGGKEAQDSSEIELEPFVIPVQSGAQGFVRLSVLLHITKDAATAIEREQQRLRLAIYNVLLNTPVESISAEEKQESVCEELKKLLNTLLGKEYILSIKFIRILVV